MDLISFSPSLLPILSLLNRKEIALCRLVNRRFCQTINSNRRIAPRKSICVRIQRFVKIPHNEYVLVSLSRNFMDLSVSIRIDNQSIYVLYCNDAKLFEYAYSEGYLKGRSVGSIVEGLRIVLQPLFLNYNFKLFYLTKLLSSENILGSTVMDIYKKNHGYLEMFHKLIWPHVNNMLVENGSINVYLPPRAKRNSLPQNLPKEGILCCIPIEKTVTSMMEVFKDWYEGRCRIFRLQFYDRSEIKDITSLYRQIAVSIGSECEWKSIPRFETFSRTRFGAKEQSPIYDVFYRRPRDDVILCFSYQQREQFLYIYDYPNCGPLEEVKFCYQQYRIVPC